MKRKFVLSISVLSWYTGIKTVVTEHFNSMSDSILCRIALLGIWIALVCMNILAMRQQCSLYLKKKRDKRIIHEKVNIPLPFFFFFLIHVFYKFSNLYHIFLPLTAIMLNFIYHFVYYKFKSRKMYICIYWKK